MNALADETSPYLLQHADNPVAWYPWGNSALERARDEQKPILLSIGYSACHWCHVMAHESFENEETAAIMNKHFINIKVDREERPDLDKIYQMAQHLLTGKQGGWPLTMFLSPDDHVPFFGGTYFPRVPRYGLPGFNELLGQIAQAYTARSDDIAVQNAQLSAALNTAIQYEAVNPSVLNGEPLETARAQFAQAFDARYGGFGSAPKFPHPSTIDRLLRHYQATFDAGTPDEHTKHMAVFTLECMADGGIYDHLGGGFCRYSVDERWAIPHFEKMLYDNGPLLALYSEAWQMTKRPLFEQVVRETAAWVLREMTSPQGAFFSSLDADSEGEEGKYYVWDRGEVDRLLGDDAALFQRRFGLDQRPNFEDKWHLQVCADFEGIAAAEGCRAGDARARIDSARNRLLEHREQRVRPGRDDKILTSWNALMIKGLAIAGTTFEDPEYIGAAERALDFIKTTLWRDGRLFATCKDGRSHLNAYLDDYVFLIDAILTLLSARWRDGDLTWAVELAEVVLDQFENRELGGFFFTSNDHEQLLQRTQAFGDDALPAGNGVAAWVLGRLGHLLGETRYLTAAERTLCAGWTGIERAPTAHAALLQALEEYHLPTQTIVLRGEPGELDAWLRICRVGYAPRRLCVAIPNDAQALPGLLAERKTQSAPVAYVCEGHTCQAPITDRDTLAEVLTSSRT